MGEVVELDGILEMEHIMQPRLCKLISHGVHQNENEHEAPEPLEVPPPPPHKKKSLYYRDIWFGWGFKQSAQYHVNITKRCIKPSRVC